MKRVKLINLLLAPIIIMALLSGCSPAVNTQGNTPGNIANGGYAAAQGSWIYYSSKSEGKMYKEKKDGSEKTAVTNDSASDINVIGDWIYYKNNSDSGSIYKIKADGTGKTKAKRRKFQFHQRCRRMDILLRRRDNRRIKALQDEA